MLCLRLWACILGCSGVVYLTLLTLPWETIHRFKTHVGVPGNIQGGNVTTQGVSTSIRFMTTRSEVVKKDKDQVLTNNKTVRKNPVLNKGKAKVLPVNIDEGPVPVSALYRPGNFSYNQSVVCPDQGRDLEVMILVFSAPANFKVRQSIRETWSLLTRAPEGRVGFAFLLGVSRDPRVERRVLQEAASHGDIVKSTNPESYDMLTLKSVALLEWASSRCGGTRFVLKTDDDVHINVPRLLSFVRSHWSDRRVIFGSVLHRRKPCRSKCKYPANTRVLPLEVFPDYCRGESYLLSGDVTGELYQQETYLRTEDALVTGIAASRLKVTRRGATRKEGKLFLPNAPLKKPCLFAHAISCRVGQYGHAKFYRAFTGNSTCA